MVKHAEPTTTVGAPGTVVDAPGTGLADTVAAAPAGSVIAVGTNEAASEAKKLLSKADKECTVVVEERLGPASLWRTPHVKPSV